MSTHPPQYYPQNQHSQHTQHQNSLSSTSTSRPHPTPPNKKRKSNSVASGSNGAGSSSKHPAKRLPSCDLCRARKVKCVKPNDGVGSSAEDRCEGCIGLNQRCEYTHERRKPGPANSFARRQSPPMTDNEYRHPPPYLGSSSHTYPLGPPPNSHLPNQPHHQPPTTTLGANNGLDIFSDSNQSNHLASLFSPTVPFDSSNPFSTGLEPELSAWAGSVSAPAFRTVDLPFLPISPSTLLHPVPGELDSSDGSPTGRWPWGNAASGWDAMDLAIGTANGLDFSGGWHPPPAPDVASYDQAERRPSSAGGVPRKTSRPFVAPKRKHGRIQRLEEVLEWSTMMRILHAYHAHLYPLMPIVHWPSFSQQLIAREDERSDLWRAFILSLVAYSIIQLPRSSLTFIPVPELRRMHQKCHSESRKLQDKRYTSVSLIDITTLYCQHIYLGTLGRTHAANVMLAEAIRLSQVLSLQDERSSSGDLDVVEREMRRRTFWLLYGSDRTITALTSDPMHIYDSDLCLPLPLSLDDNLLTPSGAFPQPPNTTPVLAGFHFNTRLLRLLGAVLTSHRNLTASWKDPNLDPFPMFSLPPPPRDWVRPPSHYLDELERILVDLPGPLQLVNPVGGEPTPNGSSASDNTHPKDVAAFATCRANLLVTQALVRFAIRQYAKTVGQEDVGEGGRDWAEKDVLGLLESMSPESLAANGDSLRAKVLFVASSLLEKYPSTTEGHNYVSDFLNVYTRISQEQHLSLLEPERSGEVSREDTPVADGHE